MYYAHSANPQGDRQPQRKHADNVAGMAADFAEALDQQDEARLAGFLHDVGKYGDRFQRRLEGEESGLDHWSPGAWIAARQYKAFAAAFAIQGHHTGLGVADANALRALDPEKLLHSHPLNLRLSEPDPTLLVDRLGADGITLQPLSQSTFPGTGGTSAMLDLRMLFSSLVDADFLDTERHFQCGSERQQRQSGLPLHPERAIVLLTEHVERLRTAVASSSDVQLVRSDLFDACTQAGSQGSGLWTLSAPTGAGKTLAMLAFALRHAMANRLRRIIVVIPYLSILDQTARVYRNLFEPVFGERYILEHHSMANTGPKDGAARDAEDEDVRQARLLTENWDAPIILTTSVQFLESLFANRPAACRKLHRIAHSVVLFDEVQTLPLRLAIPTLQTLSRLATRYKTSVVFSTATQPAFDHLDQHVQQEVNTSWQPAEIAQRSLGLFARVRRTLVHWPSANVRTPWNEIADRLAGHNQVLCIVNLKRHALLLAQLLQERRIDVSHLSTNMCPLHRDRVLTAALDSLGPDSSRPVRLISTQCIEAGVDIDFPVVYRAFGPLDAIAQAAGRCNRNGLRTMGNVNVFCPEAETRGTGFPDQAYAQAAAVTGMLLTERGPARMDINDPEVFKDYYRRLYDLAQPEGMRPELRDAILRQDFADVAKEYRVIDKDSVNVLLLFEGSEVLAEEVRANGLRAEWIRRARPFTINMFRPKPQDIVTNYLEPIQLPSGQPLDDWFIYWEAKHYDPAFGLMPPTESGFYID